MINTEEINGVIAKVNTFVAHRQWMDFSARSYQGGELEITGTLDESYWSGQRVVSIGVDWAAIRFQGWHNDTSRPVLVRVPGPEAYSISLRFNIEVGHHVFKFPPERSDEPILVATQAIRAEFKRILFSLIPKKSFPN